MTSSHPQSSATTEALSPAAYETACRACRSPFDALHVSWCSCLVTERTLVCPSCQACFCRAKPAYKQGFWAGAPRSFWEAKWEEHHAAFEPAPNPSPAEVRRPLVLVVDDEPAIRRVAARVVGGLGYGVVVAGNGEEGLALASLYRPDLALADALMPKLDGREMCRRLKEGPATASIKTVVMTALYAAIRYQTAAFKNDLVDDYVVKPLGLPQLQALLRKHLGELS